MWEVQFHRFPTCVMNRMAQLPREVPFVQNSRHAGRLQNGRMNFKPIFMIDYINRLGKPGTGSVEIIDQERDL